MKPTNPIIVSLLTLVFGWFAVPAIQGKLSDLEQSSDAALIVQPMWQKHVDMKISDNTRAITQANVHLAQLSKSVDQNGWQLAEFAKAQIVTQSGIAKIEREVTKLRIEAAKQTTIIETRLQLPTQSQGAD